MARFRRQLARSKYISSIRDSRAKELIHGSDASAMRSKKLDLPTDGPFKKILIDHEISKSCRLLFSFCRKESRKTGSLTVGELDRALNKIIQWTQEEAFPKEIKNLRAGKIIDNRSTLINLKPLIDNVGLLRVGGRLNKVKISEEQKHPIILPAKHHITMLLLREEYVELLHCGPRQLLSSIHNRYWPQPGTREVRKVTRGCVPCFRYKPKAQEHLIADLPESRVNIFSKPFAITGIDYAGSLQVRESRRRGQIHISKGYIAVFTCFATKAVHLELVSDLTTATFLAALRRFISRRGLCSTIYSDNATNFIGAARELEDIYTFLKIHNPELQIILAAQRIE
ncbi:uncharacterized protein [Mycetomoellerius zeteki]|uniref:uncharacterized protein n=1 Tax=Mycetomoellerius zeteki TaxID=64791 RepID=UPI00084E95CB|nr:PREDICTED: uncharacterized protein LOC108725083 [Trachymyrmex zeteki]